MIDFTPDPYAFQIGPIPVYWYGICYAIGLFAAYQVLVREANRRGLNSAIIGDGLIVVAIAALIGGRAYHVIDQWQRYKDDLPRIFLPPYSGLGVYGGILTGTIAAALYIRWKRQPFWRWADVVAPSLFVMQAIGRWGNFFNQELYGPPTSLPWGIAIQCKNRVAAYACPVGSDPNATLGQHFQPLFLYESLSAIVGVVVLLWVGRRWANRLRPGDLLPIFLIWYSITRFSLEFLRAGYNWTIGGVPTAQIVSAVTIALALAILVIRHARPGASVATVEAEARVVDAAELAAIAAAEAEAAAAERAAAEPTDGPIEPSASGG